MILENIKVILLDIEGTTTPIDFVHKTLFPFAKRRMFDFVQANLARIQPEILQLKDEHAADFAAGKHLETFDETSAHAISAYTLFLIENDRKSTPLKSLQGKIWQEGYQSGELVSEIYEDVPRAFRRWKEREKTIAIYSSGSTLAQKLLFKYTNYGDLTPDISAYFDTNTGGKKEAESYRKIAFTESFPQVEKILFVSDVTEELDAAEQAGMQTLCSVRESNAPLSIPARHKIIRSFGEIE